MAAQGASAASNLQAIRKTRRAPHGQSATSLSRATATVAEPPSAARAHPALAGQARPTAQARWAAAVSVAANAAD